MPPKVHSNNTQITKVMANRRNVHLQEYFSYVGRFLHRFFQAIHLTYPAGGMRGINTPSRFNILEEFALLKISCE